MKAKKKNLRKLSQQRRLVSVYREAVTSSTLYGFIAAYSDKMVAVIIINDFVVDGLSIIRRSDISKLKTSDTGKINKEMLRADGILEKIEFSDCPPLTSWRDLFESVPEREVVIIENESSKDPLFFIGRILSAERKIVAGHYFNGAGRWDDDPWEIRYKSITRCQLNTNYANAYSRHFNRIEAADTE